MAPKDRPSLPGKERAATDRTPHLAIPPQTAAEIARRAKIREERHDAQAKIVRNGDLTPRR
jgi:hypothetical protein